MDIRVGISDQCLSLSVDTFLDTSRYCETPFIHKIPSNSIPQHVSACFYLSGAESGLILDLDKTKAIFSKIKSTLNLEAALLNKDVGREGNENTRPICVSGMNDACIRNEVETFKREKCFKIQDAFFGKEKVESALFPNVNMKREYYKNLYELLERRVMRSESIRKKIILNRGITPVGIF